MLGLDPARIPEPATMQGTFNYAHPIYNADALKKQDEFHRIQGKREIWFAGARMKYGFDESGFTAGMKAAIQVCREIKLPFPLVASEFSRGMRPG